MSRFPLSSPHSLAAGILLTASSRFRASVAALGQRQFQSIYTAKLNDILTAPGGF